MQHENINIQNQKIKLVLNVIIGIVFAENVQEYGVQQYKGPIDIS